MRLLGNERFLFSFSFLHLNPVLRFSDGIETGGLVEGKGGPLLASGILCYYFGEFVRKGGKGEENHVTME